MGDILKYFVALLPSRWQRELKRIHYHRQICRNTFEAGEPEFDLLSTYVTEGDWVLDIGANVGHYSKRLSELVGPSGRVIAFEPVPETFSLLAANVLIFKFSNTTLINAAASDRLKLSGMTFPCFSTGLNNLYEAALVDSSDAPFSALTVPVDNFSISHHISLVKIDTEGHEMSVLKGMISLIRAHHPIMIIETSKKEVIEYLANEGYAADKIEGSPNMIFKPTSF